jgi:predicted TIM-barrel fold metal-dependent hydrolase
VHPHIIDAHAHCGRATPEPPQAFQDYLNAVDGLGISAAALIPPAGEIYDRSDPDFEDCDEWRRRRGEANQYVLSLADKEIEVLPYFFIWNDFAADQLDPAHRGVKWHRHPGEPPYHYEDPGCAATIAEIRRRDQPVLLEEELDNTMRFLQELAPELLVIIPHLGNANGGYQTLARRGVWDRPNVWTDTSFSPTPETIHDYLERYGHRRIMFGSDFPFSDPRKELEKVMSLDVSPSVRWAILGGNARRLLRARADSSEWRAD